MPVGGGGGVNSVGMKGRKNSETVTAPFELYRVR